MATLENAVYMSIKNDVAFLMDFQLNLYEHQSTWNPNMHNLFYAAKMYQALTRDESLYTSPQLVKILTSNFVVFYNGDKEIGDSCVLKISDSFEHPTEDPGLGTEGNGLKIVPGKDKEPLDASKALREYMFFVERVWLHAKTLTVGAAVHRAVTECNQEGNPSDFLSRNRAEVIAVSIFEYDMRPVYQNSLQSSCPNCSIQKGVACSVTEREGQHHHRFYALLKFKRRH